MTFGFMRTGFDLVDQENDNIEMDDHRRKQVMCLLELFLEDALRAAARYTKVHGVRKIGARHMKMSLQHAARTFFEQDDLEGRFATVMAREEEEEDYSMDDDSATEEDSSSNETSDDNDASATIDVQDRHVSEDDVAFCAALERHASEWSEWNPTDPAQALVKRSIDAIALPPTEDDT